MPLSTSSLQVLTALLLLTWTGGVFTKKKSFQCPLDFKLSLTEDGLPICYRLKEPEAFSEQFKDCIGNLYTSKLYLKLDLPNETNAIWTEYMTIYPGGPFMDRSYTYTNGKTFTSSFDVKYDSSLGLDEELCVVLDPVTNYTAVRCDEKYHRYCFVKPYSEEDIGSSKGCPDVSWRRYFTPSSTCLKSVIARGGSAVRAKWSQAQDLCKKREADLLREGWRYANSLVPNTPGLVAFYPLGLEMSSNQVLHSADNESLIIPQSEWRFKDLSRVEPNCSHGAIRSGAWTLVNSSFVFLDVICERSVPLRNINLTLDEDLILHVDDSLKLKEIQCFTDTHFSVEAEVTKVPGADRSYRVIPTINGYYWCTHTDVKNYHPSESNRQLYIESHRSVLHAYAVKMRVWKRYTVLNSSEMVKLWKIKLAEYIYYGNMYLREYGKLPEQDMEETLQMYKESRPEQSWQDGDVIGSVEVRRMFLDARSVLLHVRLNAVMKPIMTPGGWGLLETVVMKPLYFCEGFGTVPTKEMGQTVTQGCRTFTCVGEYNEGVQWVETASEGCTTHASVQTMVTVEDSNFTLSTRMEASTVIVHKGEVPTEPDDSSSEEFPCCLPVTTTTTGSPTEWTFTTVNTPLTTEGAVETTTVVVETEPPPLAPDEQLQQVVVELEHLLESDAPVALESIAHPFDQVNSVLDVEDSSLEIPGQLLQLLDELAARVKLATGQVAMEVRDNVAMLMADAAPDNPVRGVRVAARDYDVFSNTSFGFINDTVDSGQLLRNTSEAVVYLPASVSATPRRVSFVAFRNQRAFPSPLTVNSRVFSVKVENLTQFEDGEVIDIHLSPLVDVPERNQSRACAFWQFHGNGSGHWSTAGCTLLRAASPGAMDTCRCTHLTHFAEVLVPRSVFSERNEAALEILSIVGCALSLFGLFVIGLTASLFRSWRRDYSNKIWLQLCVSIFVLIVCFLVVVFVTFEHYSVGCMLIGVAMHYSVLASFCWMLVAAVLSYRRLVLVFTRDMSHKLLRASAFSWGLPCAIVGILLSVDPQSYQGRFEDKVASGAFCYPSGLGLWLAVYAPVAIMLLANWTLFILIVRSVFASRRIQRHGDSNEALRCASVSCLLVFLFGLPWIFGLFAYNIVLAYMFTVTATFQGFVLFVFFVLGNKKTRDLWLNKLKIKQTRKVPVTSSTYTNRSTGPGWRGGAEGASSIEAKTSKPKSLSSPDDSRFS